MKNRIQRLFWIDLREKIQQLNPDFFNLVDDLNPGKDFPIYLIHYHYGDLIGDDKSILIPLNSNEYYRLGSEQTPPLIMNELGYGTNSSPLGMFFNKNFEWFMIDNANKNNQIAFPCFVDYPGVFFSMGQVINYGYKHSHMPNGILSVSAGTRSNFMLASLGCGAQHAKLQKAYRITKSAPKTYYEHSAIFSDIVKRQKITNDWVASVLYFSDKWVKAISLDYAWKNVKDYFYKAALARSEYFIHGDYYNHIFRCVNKRNNLKKNLLIYDTARYLFEIVLGVKLGFCPANNENMLPLSLIQEAYAETYKLIYEPIIMVPTLLKAQASEPVYYSLQHPALCSYSPKARDASTVLTDAIELVNVVEKYKHDFSLPIKECKGTILEESAKKSVFRYYHSNAEEDDIIQQPIRILENDSRFSVKNKHFPEDAKFFKGCISVCLK